MGGSNKPHSIARVDGRGIARAFEQAMIEHSPTTLNPHVLDLPNSDRTVAAKPVPVWAWVDYGAQPVLVGAQMVEWTERACSLRWLTPAGEQHRAWVWRGAIEPRRVEQDPGRLASPAQRGREMNDSAARYLTSR